MENPGDDMEDVNSESQDAPEEAHGAADGAAHGAAQGAAHDAVEPSNPGKDTLDAWIDRAKRAHELVDAVDLQKVAEHDAVELNKLSTVTAALNDLSKGKEIDHVEGVDDVMPEINAEQMRKTKLFSEIAGAGWVDRMGRILSVDARHAVVKPLELIPHQEGLPDFDICIAPEQRVSYGNYGIFVSEHGVFAASIAEPVNKHHWRIDRSRPYENEEELTRSITQFSQIDE
jgi:hypothetical protein